MLFLLHLGKRFTSETQGQVLRRVITPYSQTQYDRGIYTLVYTPLSYSMVSQRGLSRGER